MSPLEDRVKLLEERIESLFQFDAYYSNWEVERGSVYNELDKMIKERDDAQVELFDIIKRYNIEHEHLLKTQDLLVTQSLRITELEPITKDLQDQLDQSSADYQDLGRLCAEDGETIKRLEARIAELEQELHEETEHAHWLDVFATELEAKLKSVLPCFCKGVR